MSKAMYQLEVLKKKKTIKEKIKELKKEKEKGVDQNKLSTINAELFDLEYELKNI